MRSAWIVSFAALLVVVAPGGPARAAYPGDNGRLYLPRRGDVYSMRSDGSRARQITDTDAYEGSISVSPSGRRLAFSVGGGTYETDLYVMRATGEHRRRIVDMVGGSGGASWSPDGRTIAFANVRRRRPGDIYTVRPDGTHLRRLTYSRAREIEPVWSPDGDRIAVVSYRKTELDELWTMDRKGNDWVRVTRGATDCGEDGPCEDRYGGFSGIDYAPDGDRLVFAANKGDGPSEIWVVKEDGGHLRKLTTGMWPAWSPNGRKIIFSGRRGLTMIRADCTHRHRIGQRGYYVDWAVRHAGISEGYSGPARVLAHSIPV
jgi:Tol biopolymer transport system component